MVQLRDRRFQRVHANSKRALRKVARIDRKMAILAVFRAANRSLTDRQVMVAMGFVDPNKVRPRITELIKESRLVEVEGASPRQTMLPALVGEQRRLF